MNETTHRFRPHEPDWEAWRRRAPHDVYHSAAYHALAETSGEGEAHLVVHGTPERFVAWPYLTRTIDDGHADACSVYGYTGPFGNALDDAGFVGRAWRAFREIWAEQRLVTLFTRFHPLLDNASACDALHGTIAPTGGERFTIGRTVSIDLALSPEERRRAYKKVLRQEIAAAGRAGLVVEEDVGRDHYARFVELYRETMARNAASERYLFSDAYFAALREALGDSGHLALARVGDTPVALLLFTVHDGIAQAHLTGASAEWRHLSPTKALIDGVADLARAHGAGVLHLGAGRGGLEDALFDFKARFSSRRHAFVLGRWILDADAHERLSAGIDPAANPDGVWFPLYRTPRPAKTVS